MQPVTSLLDQCHMCCLVSTLLLKATSWLPTTLCDARTIWMWFAPVQLHQDELLPSVNLLTWAAFVADLLLATADTWEWRGTGCDCWGSVLWWGGAGWVCGARLQEEEACPPQGEGAWRGEGPAPTFCACVPKQKQNGMSSCKACFK